MFLFWVCCVFNLFFLFSFIFFIYLYKTILDKFYKTTNIVENNNSYGILLDNSKLKTPLGNELIINSKALALAIAEEWAMQKEKIQIDPMHLVRLCKNLVFFFIKMYFYFFTFI